MNQKETIPGLCLAREPSREERWLSRHLCSGTVTAAIPLRGESSTVGVWDGEMGKGREKVRHERTLKVFPVSYPRVPAPLAWPIPASPGPIPWAEEGSWMGRSGLLLWASLLCPYEPLWSSQDESFTAHGVSPTWPELW